MPDTTSNKVSKIFFALERKSQLFDRSADLIKDTLPAVLNSDAANAASHYSTVQARSPVCSYRYF